MPLAIPSIMVGVNQTIMIAVAMMVFSSLIGATGLGLEILTAILQVDIGQGINAGLALVLMAVVLDRMAQGVVKNRQTALGLG